MADIMDHPIRIPPGGSTIQVGTDGLLDIERYCTVSNIRSRQPGFGWSMSLFTSPVFRSRAGHPFPLTERVKRWSILPSELGVIAAQEKQTGLLKTAQEDPEECHTKPPVLHTTVMQPPQPARSQYLGWDDDG